MYKRILIPSDGAEASQRAILAGIDFAREVGADVVGLTATPEQFAAHGRRGLKGVLLLGSETRKAPVHSTIPVLVHR